MEKVKFFPTISINNIEVELLSSQPKFSQSDFPEMASNWIKKQGQFWPSEIKSHDLLENIQLYFIPLWIFNGHGSASWSASIGHETYKLQTCGRCHGRGKVKPSENNVMYYDTGELVACTLCEGTGQEKTKTTTYISEAGLVNANIHNNISNCSQQSISLLLKKVDSSFPRNFVNKAQAVNVSVLAFEKITKDSGVLVSETIFQEVLRQNALTIASTYGSVRDLHLANIQTQLTNVSIWLYPVFLGTYQYAEEAHLQIQIDALTGEFQAELPQSVKNKRQNLLFISITLIISVILILLVYFYSLSASTTTMCPTVVIISGGAEVELDPRCPLVTVIPGDF